MTTDNKEILTIVYDKDGWHVFDLVSSCIVQSNYREREHAEEGMKVRVYRLNQGWAP